MSQVSRYNDNDYDRDDDKIEISPKEQRKQQFNQKKRKMVASTGKSDSKIRLFQKGRSNSRPSTKDLIYDEEE